MNILLEDGLPEEYEGMPLSTDFRNMIRLDLILHDPELSETEKTYAALNQLYPETPSDPYKALEGLEWFFLRGKKSDGKGTGKADKKGFDFEQDDSKIYAAFLATYQISLSTVEYLHWWEFMALFESLPETTLIQRVIYWRTADTKGLSKHEKKHIEKMRKLFALKVPEREAMSLEEMEQKTKDNVAQIFEKAKAWAEQKKNQAAE